MTIYQDMGYRDRDHYLHTLADDYGVELSRVLELAAILGSGEDFDALVVYLDEYSDLDY